MLGMTLEQIAYFVASAETGSFSAAAKRLYVTHSSVSRGVSTLERELGVPLLVRGRRALSCTPAGQEFLTRGRGLLKETEALREAMGSYRTGRRLHIVSIGAYIPKAYALIRQYREANPDVHLELEQADQRALLEKLYAGEADLGIGFSYSFPKDAELETLVLDQGRFCVLLSPDHPLSGRTYLTPEELAGEPGILGGNPFLTDRTRADSGMQDVQSIILQIKAGEGITILPEHAAAEFGQGCVQIPIRGAMDGYQLLLAWRRGSTARQLLEAVAFFQSQLRGTQERGANDE